MELEVLRNKIKKDPDANYDSFFKKYKEFNSTFEIVKLNPNIYNDQFVHLLDFVTSTISFYNSGSGEYDPNNNSKTKDVEDCDEVDGRLLCLKLVEFVKRNKNLINVKMRKLIVGSTFLLRSRKQIDLITILDEWLDLLDLNDKDQRKRLFNYIVRDIMLLNNKLKSNKMVVLKNIENMLFERINNKNVNLNTRLLCICIVIEIYNKKVFTNNSVYMLNKLSGLTLNDNNKISLLSVYFLLSYKNYYNLIFTDDGDELNEPTGTMRYEYILDLYEPYKLVNNLLSKINSNTSLKYENKLVILKLLAIIINKHKLIVPNYYSYLVKYINYKQKFVTKVLLAFIISVHEQVDCGLVNPIVEKIISDFVSYDRSDSTIIIGLNTIREICNRLPDVLNAETLEYLLEFKSYKSKNVNISVKGLVNLYRKKNPKLLSKSMRDKESNIFLLNEKKMEKLMNSLNGNKIKDEKETEDDHQESDPEIKELVESEYEEENDETSEVEEEGDEIGSILSEDIEEIEDEEEDDKEDSDEDESSINNSEDEGEESGIEMNENKLLFMSNKKMKSYEKRREKIMNKMNLKKTRKLAQSKKGKKQSLSNKIKERNKPILMTLHSKRVKSKKNLSVKQQMNRLKKHIKAMKKGNLKKKQRRHG